MSVAALCCPTVPLPGLGVSNTAVRVLLVAQQRLRPDSLLCETLQMGSHTLSCTNGRCYHPGPWMSSSDVTEREATSLIKIKKQMDVWMESKLRNCSRIKGMLGYSNRMFPCVYSWSLENVAKMRLLNLAIFLKVLHNIWSRWQKF